MDYPSPKKIPTSQTLFDLEVSDDYAWMRDIETNPDIKKILQRENELTSDYLSDMGILEETLFEEFKSRELLNYDTASYKHGPYHYFERYQEEMEYPLHCRRKIGSDKVEVCLDENELALGHDYFSLGFFDLSTDHKILAFSVDTNGNEQYTLKFKNLETGMIYPYEVENVATTVSWFKDLYALTYVLQDENQRPYKVMIHQFDETEDRCIYEENSGEYFVSVTESMDHKFILISSDGSITNEVHYIDSTDPLASLKLIRKRKRGHEYYVEHKENFFYIITNDVHPNFRVVKAPTTASNNWSEFIPPRDEFYINDFSCFKKFFVLCYKENGLNKFKIIRNNGEVSYINFPEKAYYSGAGDNAEYETDFFRYDYYSLTTPLTTYDFNIKDAKSSLYYQKEVPTFDPNLYQVQRVEALSHDQKKIPLSILYKKETPLDGSAPLLLYGYGAYGSCIEPWFDSRVLSLVDRGFVYAIAHVRGSATLGRNWYEDGKFLKKKNSFLDFNSCAHFLCENNFTSNGKIIANGGSAGGLLVAGAMEIDKDNIYRAIIADVPFVDVLNTMLDASLPLTELEYDEWGNPNEEKYFKYIRSYCPYQSISQRSYPAILALAGLNDNRVSYWEPMKWIYKLRDHATDKHPKLLKTNMDSGHSGASGRFEFLKEDAMTYTFIIKVSKN